MPIQFDQTTAGVANLGTTSGSTSYSLVFPSSNGSNGNYLINDGSGNLSWGSPSANGFSSALNVNSPNNTVNVSSLSASGGTTNQFIALVPSTTTAAILGNIPDGTATGGNARGSNVVDFQLSRSSATAVASGTGSVVLGGYNNAASNTYSAVLGGSGNSVSSAYAAIFGGYGNSISSSTTSLIMGGSGNSASASYSAILGGRNNSTVSSGMVLGGYANNGSYGKILWNQANPLNLLTNDALIGRSWTGDYLRSSVSYTNSTLTSFTARNNSVYFYEVIFLANVGPPNSAYSPGIQRGYYLAKKTTTSSWVAGTAEGAMPFYINNSDHTASVSNSGVGLTVTVTNTFNNNTSTFSSVRYFYIVVA